MLFLLILVCLIVLLIIHAVILRSRMRTAIVFRYIGLVVRQNLPLSAGLHYAAFSELGPARRILARTSRLLETGVSLSQALSTSYLNCPALPISVVQAAESTGTLPAALLELNNKLTRRESERGDDSTYRWVLLALVAVIFLGVFMVYCYYVVPKFEVIFRDFDIELPLWTSEVLAANPFSTTAPTTVWGSLYSLVLGGLAALAPILVFASLLRLRPRRAHRLGVISVAVDSVKWHLWPTHGMAVAEGCNNSLPMLRLALAAGWPLHDAITHAGKVDANYIWRQKWDAWAEHVRAGADPIEMGRHVGMPDVLMRHVAIGIRHGDLEAPLYNAERYYGALLFRWHQLLFHLLWPIGTLLLAAIVAVFCLSMFVPLMALVDMLCSMI